MRPRKENSTREPYNHWIFGNYEEFEFQPNEKPTESDVIKRFLFIKEQRHKNYCTKDKKNKIIWEISEELKEKWINSHNPLIHDSEIRQKISNLISKALEHDKKKSYYKQTPNYIQRRKEKYNTCFNISKRIIDNVEAKNKLENLS